jgi:flagellar basal body-associated protein FliL
MIKSKKKYVLVIIPVILIAAFIATLCVGFALFNPQVEKEV